MSGIFILWLSLSPHPKGSELHKPERETMQNGIMLLGSPYSPIKIYYIDSRMLWLLILQLLPQQIEQ